MCGFAITSANAKWRRQKSVMCDVATHQVRNKLFPLRVNDLNSYCVHWGVEGKSTLHHQVGFPAPHRSMLKCPAMGNDPKETFS